MTNLTQLFGVGFLYGFLFSLLLLISFFLLSLQNRHPRQRRQNYRYNLLHYYPWNQKTLWEVQQLTIIISSSSKNQ